MGLRSRVGDTLVRVGKTFGTSVPESFQQGEEASQMTPASPFGPGAPIGPYDGYDRHPRTFNFQTAYNIATRPRTNEAVSFATLTGLVESYDVAQIVIWHRIDSIRSLDWRLIPAENYHGDVTDAIPLGLAALRSPDRRNSFKTWLARYLYDILAWDAGTLYRLRNRGGKCIGLQPVDGRTIAPLLDYWGNSPGDGAEAYVQYVNGLPFNWLTRDDLIYEPFRPVTGSPYGRPPIESVILNANTDLRFQVFFLQYFTDGNVPAAFASSPDTWSPDQIEQWQGYWDAMMYGDQSRKHQIRWMPGGSKIMWSNEKEFSDVFSLYLMRKTAAAYHVVPADIGFTENVNRSSGESQADVQHRVGDLPLMEHVEGILSQFLQDDLGLPLRHEFDRGEEQVDQLAQAQADQAYMDRAVVSPSEIREMRYGLTDAKPVPRVFFTSRSGPIPLNSLLSVAGPVDPQTAAPAEGAELPHEVYTGAPGVEPNPPLYPQPLAEQIYGPGAVPAGTETSSTMPVAKEGEGAAGITSETGIYGYDLERGDDEPGEAAVAKEMAAFRRFERARRKSGEWRDFEFRAVEAGEGTRLNAAGRQAVRKDGTPGLTSRSGMISLDLPPGIVQPPPGGVTDQHVTVVYLGPDVDDEAFAAACSRAAAAAALVAGPLTASPSGVSSFPPSDGSDGKVPAFVPVTIDGAEVLRSALEDLSASEHKDWHPHVTLAYLEPGEPLPDPCEPVTAVLTHLSVHRGDGVVSFPLGSPPACCGAECCQDGGCCGGGGGCSCGTGAMPAEGDEATCPCGTPVVSDESNGWQHADGSIGHDDGESVSDKMAAIAKAGDSSAPPKGRDPDDWTGIWGRTHDRRQELLAGHERAVLAAWNDLTAGLSPLALVRQFREDAGLVAKLADPDRPYWKDRGRDAALAWLSALQQRKGWAALTAAIEDAIRDGMAEGETDSLAVAADRQGVKGFSFAAAFTAAAQAFQGDPDVSRRAHETAQVILAGAAIALAVTLADGAEDGSSEAEMAAAASDAVTGPDVSPVKYGLADALWAAAGAGLLGLIGRLFGGGTVTPPGTVPGSPPMPPQEPPTPGIALINWVCEGGNPCVACLDNQGGSPYLPQDVPQYLAHSHCKCALYLASDVPPSFFAAYLLK